VDAGTPRIGRRVASVECCRRSLGAWALIVVLVCGAPLTVPARAAATLGPVLKPNLVADPPEFVKSQELLWEGQKRLLMRFNGYIHNQGPGRLEIRGRRVSALEPMNVYQRLYLEGAKEVHGEQPASEYEERFLPEAELLYDTDDGHDHFHLQEVAHYSLWNSDKTQEVAPSQKVGFCLTDSERVEATGPTEAFYHDEEERRFCDHGEPEALSVWEGISVGWRDLYKWELALQWVDISNVAPGEYWLRADVDPRGLLIEKGLASEPAKHAYSKQPVTVPGYDALSQSVSDENGGSITLTLSAKAFGVSGEPQYVIAEEPLHGTLGEVKANHVTYKPQRGYNGHDSFTLYAKNPNSNYPLTPVDASVSLNVGAATTTTTTTTTTLTSSPAASATVTTSATTSAVTTPKKHSSGYGQLANPASKGPSDLAGAIRGGSLIVSARAGSDGLLTLSAYSGKRQLGRCVAHVRAGQTHTCRMKLTGRVSASDGIDLWAALQSARRVLRAHHRLTATPARGHARKADAGAFLLALSSPLRGGLPASAT
jgi:hypothetical protein